MMPRRYNRPSGEKQTVSGSDEVLKLLGTTLASNFSVSDTGLDYRGPLQKEESGTQGRHAGHRRHQKSLPYGSPIKMRLWPRFRRRPRFWNPYWSGFPPEPSSASENACTGGCPPGSHQGDPCGHDCLCLRPLGYDGLLQLVCMK
ncbi:uncharacterized protein LOC142817436 isoform X1 [Rhipicephalus microplus]|uniref:uncharacterized protein LOC142817436 isoform X1 n=1 Tax=Rhipicephalus microplus TaxID=6941 RepID=UPI003F6CACE4